MYALHDAPCASLIPRSRVLSLQRPAATVALLLAAAAVLVLAAPAAGASTSKYFGAAGEKWKPTGPFMDFSYAGMAVVLDLHAVFRAAPLVQAGQAQQQQPHRCRRLNAAVAASHPSAAGYRQSNAAIPTPPVTKTLREFQAAGRSDTEAMLAMVAWANKQPAIAGAHAGLAHAELCMLRPAARPGLDSALCSNCQMWDPTYCHLPPLALQAPLPSPCHQAGLCWSCPRGG